MRLRSVLLAVVAVGLTGCTSGLTDTTPTTVPDTTVPAPVRAVRLATDAGEVTVQGTAGATGATVHRVLHNRSGRPVGDTTTVAGGELTLRGCGDECAVDYTVTVPLGTPVSGRGVSGTLVMRGLADVDVATTNGDVLLDNVVRGRAAARSVDGDVRGTALHTTGVTAQSTNGDVDLTVTAAQDVTASSTNGTITVTTPGGPYRVRATTTNGSAQVGVTNDPAAQHQLDLRTGNGDITVRAR